MKNYVALSFFRPCSWLKKGMVELMDKKSNLILVDSNVLPEVYVRVLEAKRLLAEGRHTSVGEAVHAVGISRSAFYKYKDYVFPFNQMQGIITLSFVLIDLNGVLSTILNIISNAQCNILSINQSIPLGGVANVTVTVQTEQMSIGLDELIDLLGESHGVRSIEVIAKQ